MKPDFDTSKYYLGTVCKRGHCYKGQYKSIRAIRNRECAICAGLRAKDPRIKAYKSKWFQKNKHRRRIYMRVCRWCGQGFETYTKSAELCSTPCVSAWRKFVADSKKIPVDHDVSGEEAYLGNLCARGHDYNSTGKSLRSMKKGQCLHCKKERREFAYGGREKRNSLFKERYAEAVENSGKLCACGCRNNVHPDKMYIAGHQSRVNHPMKGRTGKLAAGYIHGMTSKASGGNNNPEYKRRWQQRNHWKEVLQFAEARPAKEKKEILDLVAVNVEVRLAQLDNDSLLRERGKTE